ncbi:hypothetical protein CsatB_020224 [Cannabis sativa]|uniref:DUF674 domain-containing protein n=1 Tax=Cannabis sativa TaxID=3483 RepID=A0A7J6GHH2_CANSA|nr:uncharacterized protein LOC115701224 [Cannabis sativa]XP_060958800.1 uncharacterized protein LOC115701224 [Cannabis sativa]KAF4349152.1 hypothetical protein G4B88_020391 [Cannabis sativa]KAF4381730.1 hypothetical protein F8388_021358 [Cannabis sativa]
MDTVKISLKLLIDKKNEKVLFAEAGKDFVDFLFTLLSLPVATVIRLLNSNNRAMAGGLEKIYKSIENLEDTYILSTATKETLLKPKISPTLKFSLLSLPPSSSSSATASSSLQKKMYICVSCYSYVSDDLRAVCPRCLRSISKEVSYVPAMAPAAAQQVVGNEGGGYVKGVVTYMVMDDLEVKPMSTISSISMLRNFNVKDLGVLEEKTVKLSMNEGLKLLEASFISNTVLSDVFMLPDDKKKAKRRR